MLTIRQVYALADPIEAPPAERDRLIAAAISQIIKGEVADPHSPSAREGRVES